jgi:putative ABC transport system ATP-binding protein
MTPIVELHSIHKVYELEAIRVCALRGINLILRQGEFVAIMGASGSGKSTLLNVLGCLDQPSEGTYLLDGERVDQFNEDKLAECRRTRMGFVFQSFNLLSRMSAIEQVELPLLYRRTDNRRQLAIQALADVGLGGRISRRPTQLSGGEQQRVAIARALVVHPSLILADEPTGALDTATGYEIMGIFRRLNTERDMTIVLVTHERNIAAYAHRVVELQDGLIISDTPNSHPPEPDGERAS